LKEMKCEDLVKEAAKV